MIVFQSNIAFYLLWMKKKVCFTVKMHIGTLIPALAPCHLRPNTPDIPMPWMFVVLVLEQNEIHKNDNLNRNYELLFFVSWDGYQVKQKKTMQECQL